ncbi:Clavaminate synthase-like protein [Byssothecium circinans]|uniref:Clavaminate synthase-like protein n=1 Tax=Byssothecium circinans TaxID=147558 RepID=A0A6A5UAS0_9PLEO|nr:Clavaminate synthase-like protein [Byssothecium circinans]
MRHVSLNRPFVIRSGAQDWKALKKWNAAYLEQVMQGQSVNVAVTPLGNADSVVHLDNDKASHGERKVFVKPYETTSPFSTVLRQIQAQAQAQGKNEDGKESTEPTRYAQTQNDNLRNEYTSLFTDVPKSIPFARIALEKDPDAINFWLGNSHSVTALHKDNYENVYVQILGKKHFVLMPPVEAPCVGEKSVLVATYRLREGKEGGEWGREDLVVGIDEPEQYVPFATWDPDSPGENATPFSHLSRLLRVTLNEGDMLYLPALWYHKVSQSCSEEGICCAVNYWYDLDFSGSFWSMANFVRGVGLLALSEGKKEEDVENVEQ